ncbi:sensor histidine kinase [Alkaliphilus serpentinus]|uniref:Oxygen sensor histidine kinase NreB n=1 Tax=Alkaliphilus serpentinus TaxID=1482731 RepID=A0A833HNY4_9FIRM|nr:sensor histidine kinase [Alkaliphilus serpentinus]KAB3530053.1 sensor histidine kinase [Alkaliphilus serpentinus]
MNLKLFTSNRSKKGLRWEILTKIYLSSILGITLTTLFIYTSLSIVNWGQMSLLNSYVLNNFHILITSMIAASFIPVMIIGIPFSYKIKNSLSNLEEALESLSRGRIDLRLGLDDYYDFNRLNHQYNLTADQIQRQVESLQRLVNENKKILLNAEAAASLGERKKIARELHDSISQQLFAISITMGAIKNIIEKNPQEARKHFDNVEKMVNLAQQELRALLMHLRPVRLNGTPLNEGVTALLRELKEKNKNIDIKWNIDEVAKLSQGVEDHLFRVLQEALSNALRHSKASLIKVKLFIRNNLLLLFIEDNGVGFSLSQDKKTSYGVSTMQERVTEIGGRIEILSYPGKGTRIEIRVPIDIEGTYKIEN